MTLCIAWVKNGAVHLMSDSRISAGRFVDGAVKITEVPIRVLNPHTHLATDSSLGIAYAGSTQLANIVRDKLAVCLATATLNPLTGDPSLHGYARLAAKLHGQLVKEFRKAWGDGEDAEIFLAGYCTVLRKGRIFKIEYQGNGVSQELELSDGIHFIGDGASVAENYRDNSGTPYHILLRVINDRSVETVGGLIQAGVVEDERFRVKGVVIPGDHSNAYALAGSDFLNSDILGQDFVATGTYLCPFNL